MDVPQLDLMTQLAQHVAAVQQQGGASLPKGDAFYGGHLGRLSDGQRAEIRAYCGKHGVRASLARDALGGPSMRIGGSEGPR
ncbi:MAG: hypothetical protein ABII12_03215 [Planctomycetota bacterium]